MADFIFGQSDVITAPYTGAAKTYEITFDGFIQIKAWGAGGGGGIVHSSIQTTGYRTGGGGYADGSIAVEVGDIIKVEVGQGGRRAETETTGSLGGWPDGGRGTQGTAGSGGNFYRGGGGGGSTRVYKNDVLILVAGASGGGCRYFGGAGGGSTGGTGGSGGGAGGTQTTAGTGGGLLDGGDAPLAPTAGSSSGGGGGGYYGGGYATGTDNTAGGGGGSGYKGTLFGQLVQGSNTSAGTAAQSTDPDYISGVGLGGQTLAGPATTTHGGDGLVVMRESAGSEFNLVENAQTTLPNDAPFDQAWTINKGGTVTFDLWGAGGGGAYSPIVGGTYPRGGGGGHTRVQFNVNIGDQLVVQVGQGGLRGRPSTGNGDPGGGWPDGGHAGINTSSSACGSGGGSTRVFLNGELIAVAGAGGGGGIPSRADKPGAGGGASGQSSVDDASAVTAATGGSQSAGGVNAVTPADTGYWGGFLQGGNGRPSTVGPAVADSACAAGGGGGYYGGGGAGQSGAFFRAGGGGSGYLTPDAVEGLTEAGNLGVPAATSNPLYPGGNVGYGGLGAGSAAGTQNGYPGAATYLYEPIEGGVGNLDTVVIVPVEAVATGGITVDTLLGPLEVTISSPQGDGVVSAGGTGDLSGPVIVTGVDGTALAQVGATGPIGTVTVLSLIEGGPPQEVNVILDLLVEFDGGVFITDMPSATAGGSGAANHTSYPFAPISVIPVQGFYTSADQEGAGDIGTVVTSSVVDGYAVEAFESVLDSTVTATSFMEASATGAAAISARISLIPENGQGGGLVIGAVNGTPSTPNMEATGEIGSIAIEPLLGVGLDGDDITLAVGVMPDRIEAEWTNTDAVQATGGGQAFSVGNASGSNNPADNYLVRVWRNANVNGSASGSAAVTADLTGTITFAAPQGVTIRGQSIFAPIGTVFLRRPLGSEGGNPAIEGDALAGYDLRDMPIVITPPDGGFAISGEAVGQGQLTVVVLPPAASSDIGQDQAHDIPGPIILTQPEGAAASVDPDSTAEADLTAVVTLLPPEAQPVVPVAVMLPGAVVLSPVLATFKLVAVAGTAVFIRQVDGEAVFRRVENAVAVVEDRIERTVVFRG